MKAFVLIRSANNLNKVGEWKIFKKIKDKGGDVYPVFVDFSYLFLEDNNYYIKSKVLKDNLKKVKIEENDIFIVRAPALSLRKGLKLFGHLVELQKELNLTFYNNFDFLYFCNDKYRNYIFFKQYEIPTPKTYCIPYVNKNKSDKQLKEIGKELGYPLILKTIEGSMGNGVIKIYGEDQFQSIAELLNKKGGLLAQEYIENEFDVRVFMWKDEILGAMKRNKIEGDFRSNVSKGAEADKYDLTVEEEDVCKFISRELEKKYGSLGAIGLDFMVDKNKGLMFLEVNGSPGIKISDIIDVDIVDVFSNKIIEMIDKNKDENDDNISECKKIIESNSLNNNKSVEENETVLEYKYYKIFYDSNKIYVKDKENKEYNGKLIEKTNNLIYFENLGNKYVLKR